MNIFLKCPSNVISPSLDIVAICYLYPFDNLYLAFIVINFNYIFTGSDNIQKLLGINLYENHYINFESSVTCTLHIMIYYNNLSNWICCVKDSTSILQSISSMIKAIFILFISHIYLISPSRNIALTDYKVSSSRLYYIGLDSIIFSVLLIHLIYYI